MSGAPVSAGPARGAPGMDRLDRAIDAAAGYLVRVCGGDGRFLYRLDLDSGEKVGDSYNIVRHAGAVYALARYAQHRPRPEVLDAIRRSTAFLVREAVRPVRGDPAMLAVWSDPAIEGPATGAAANLGGAGLALAALSVARPIVEDIVDDELPRALVRFIRYLQNPSGSFCTRFDPRTGLPDNHDPVLFFPGEAMLGLAFHHALEPGPELRRCALRGMTHLARRAHETGVVEPDHWTLLAADAWAPWLRDGPGWDRLVEHWRAIARRLAGRRPPFRSDSPLHGCFNTFGQTCGTATSLEGLLAACSLLATVDDALVRELAGIVDDGLWFLLRARQADGPWAGAMPAAIRGVPSPVAAGALPLNLQPAPSEVRIDFVQHALCAMIQARFGGPPRGAKQAQASVYSVTVDGHCSDPQRKGGQS